MTLHPGRMMMETSERQPFVVGVVMVDMSSWSWVGRYTRYLPTTVLAQQYSPHFRGWCCLALWTILLSERASERDPFSRTCQVGRAVTSSGTVVGRDEALHAKNRCSEWPASHASREHRNGGVGVTSSRRF